MWKIKHIFDGDYGCEERLESENPKVTGACGHFFRPLCPFHKSRI